MTRHTGNNDLYSINTIKVVNKTYEDQTRHTMTRYMDSYYIVAIEDQEVLAVCEIFH